MMRIPTTFPKDSRYEELMREAREIRELHERELPPRDPNLSLDENEDRRTIRALELVLKKKKANEAANNPITQK